MLPFRSAIKLQRSILSSQICSENKSSNPQQQKRNLIKFSRDAETKSIKLTWVGLPTRPSKFTFTDVKIDTDNVEKVTNYLDLYENRHGSLFFASFFSSIPLTFINFAEYCNNAPLLFQALCVSNLLASVYFYQKTSHFGDLKLEIQEKLYPNGEGLPADFYKKHIEDNDNIMKFFMGSALPALALLGIENFSLIAALPLISAVLLSSLSARTASYYNNKSLQMLNKK